MGELRAPARRWAHQGYDLPSVGGAAGQGDHEGGIRPRVHRGQEAQGAAQAERDLCPGESLFGGAPGGITSHGVVGRRINHRRGGGGDRSWS